MGSKFHLSLNVSNLRETAAFLDLLLGVKPEQLHDDYAKFELQDPAIVLSLVPTDLPTAAGLNHVGFRLPSGQALKALADRLTTAGVAHELQESVACCHSRQTKFWVNDPAGNLWELYVLEDAEAGNCEPVAITPLTARTPSDVAPPRVWSHRLGQAFPQQIPADDGSLDEVVLEGTFNAGPAALDFCQALVEVARALRSGGKLLLHGLTADHGLAHPPRLPGPAAAVEQAPTTAEVLSAVCRAGFVGLELITFGETYRFDHAGAELRETRLLAWRADDTSANASGDDLHTIIYRGPFVEVRDDSGIIFRRGEPTAVDMHTWQRLKESNAAEQFLFILGPRGAKA
jgi:extradiol dioxygenase family protein